MAKRVKKKITQSTTDKTNAVTGKISPEATVYDSPEVLQDQIGRSQAYLEKNKKTVTGIAIALVAMLVVAFGINTYQESKEEEAQVELSPAVFYFENDSLDKALNGDNNTTTGLLAVAEDYGSTNAGNLANFYIGASYMKQKKFDDAITYLEDFSSSDALVQARTYSLIGDAYMEKDALGEAVSAYKKAVGHEPNSQFTPAYMMKLALAYELNGNQEGAKGTYESLIKKYPQAREINNAKKYLAQF